MNTISLASHQEFIQEWHSPGSPGSRHLRHDIGHHGHTDPLVIPPFSPASPRTLAQGWGVCQPPHSGRMLPAG